METNDLGSKKINNEQSVNEGFSSENLSQNYNPSTMKTEVEIDAAGNRKDVDRARNVDGTENNDANSERNWNESESLSRSMSTEEIKTAVENKDHNYDTPLRYPDSHPDNHEDRGNIKLDE